MMRASAPAPVFGPRQRHHPFAVAPDPLVHGGAVADARERRGLVEPDAGVGPSCLHRCCDVLVGLEAPVSRKEPAVIEEFYHRARQHLRLTFWVVCFGRAVQVVATSSIFRPRAGWARSCAASFKRRRQLHLGLQPANKNRIDDWRRHMERVRELDVEL
jgi:hypothetical protein